MSFAKDWNVQNRIRQEAKYGEAEAYAKNMQDIAKNSNWYDRQLRSENARKEMNEQQFLNRNLPEIQQEVKERRKARLRELLQHDAAQYERELASKGLAIYRDKL